MTDLSLTVSRRISAAPEKVFNAWLDPAMLSRFMTPKQSVKIQNANTDPRVGGRFDILMVDGDTEIPHAGTYKEISPHNRIVFTWESPYSTDDSTVTLDFSPEGGGTEVTLTHVKFLSESARDSHKGGWTSILDALAKAA